jgi:syntaxin 18
MYHHVTFQTTTDNHTAQPRSRSPRSQNCNLRSQPTSAYSQHIDQLVEDSFNTTENVGSGNRELKRATERGSFAQKVFWVNCAFCTVLVVWDLIF